MKLKSNVVEALRTGRGLPLVAAVPRLMNLGNAVPVTKVTKSGSPDDGAYFIQFTGTDPNVTATSINLDTNVRVADEAITGGGTSTTLVPGCTLTFPATEVAGDCLVVVTRLGDPKIDQAWATADEVESGTDTDHTLTVGQGLLGIPSDAHKLIVMDADLLPSSEAVANLGSSNKHIFQIVDGGSNTLFQVGYIAQYNTGHRFPATGVVVDLTLGSATLEWYFATTYWRQAVANGWYE